MTDIEGISEGRKQVALEKADEARREWMRAERAEAEVARLRAALELWHHAVKIDVTMEGPQYMGVSSILGRQAWERTRAALQQEPKP